VIPHHHLPKNKKIQQDSMQKSIELLTKILYGRNPNRMNTKVMMMIMHRMNRVNRLHHRHFHRKMIIDQNQRRKTRKNLKLHFLNHFPIMFQLKINIPRRNSLLILSVQIKIFLFSIKDIFSKLDLKTKTNVNN